MRHLIVGLGPIGQHLAAHLVEQGEEVHTLSRRSGLAPQGAREHRGDILDAESGAHFKSMDVVYHCANAPYQLWEQRLPALWTAVLENACRQQNRLVIVSNLYAYGEPENPLTADHPWQARTRKGRVRIAVEGAVKKAAADGRLQACVVRASDFYGPLVRDSALGSRFFPALTAGKPATFYGSLEARHSYSYAPDVARAMAALGRLSRYDRFEYLVPNAPPLTPRELSRLLSDLTGHPVRPRIMGKTTLRLGGVFIPAAKEMIEMLYQWERDFIAEGREEAALLGVQPTPLAEGLAATLEWYRNNGGQALAET